MMDYGSYYHDYLDEHEEEIQEDGAWHIATLVLCECGKEWTKFWDDKRLVSVDEWDDMIDTHFYGSDGVNEHDAMMGRKLTDEY